MMHDCLYFTMGDALRVCDEFGAWLVDTNGDYIFPNNGQKVSCVFPVFDKYLQNETSESAFVRFCADKSEIACEIPADVEIVRLIIRAVFEYWTVGDFTMLAIKRLRDKLEKEGRLMK